MSSFPAKYTREQKKAAAARVMEIRAKDGYLPGQIERVAIEAGIHYQTVRASLLMHEPNSVEAQREAARRALPPRNRRVMQPTPKRLEHASNYTSTTVNVVSPAASLNDLLEKKVKGIREELSELEIAHQAVVAKKQHQITTLLELIED